MLRRIVVLMTIGIFSLELLHAQVPDRGAGPRVRVTGSRSYEIPGVLKIDQGLVSGSSLVTDESTIRLVSPETGQPLVVLKPGVRMIGRAVGVANQTVTLVVEDRGDSITIPLGSIGRLEVSESRRHLLRGILVGSATFYLTGALIVWTVCGLSCGADETFIPAVGVGLTTGIIAGRRRDTWKVVPTDWLLSNTRLQPSAAGIF